MPPGPALGLGGLPFESVDLDLPEGTVLALYTDGLLESRERDVDSGLRLLCRALEQSSQSLEGAAHSILQALLPPGGAPDDVALLLARTHGLAVSDVTTWDIPADPALVAPIRRQVADQLDVWGLTVATFTAELVVSELVTNAIRYGEPPIRLRLIHDSETLICEVSDSSHTAPHLRRAKTFDEGGRGLLLVAQLTQRWGSRRHPGGQDHLGGAVARRRGVRAARVRGAGRVAVAVPGAARTRRGTLHRPPCEDRPGCGAGRSPIRGGGFAGGPVRV